MMMHRSNAGRRTVGRVLLSLLASVCLLVGSPVVGVSSAATGAHKPVSSTFGDCKNDNKGKHNGYDCPVQVQDDSTTPPADDTPPPVIWVS
jgi:hypothetical protein